jgi:hypothetical protein
LADAVLLRPIKSCLGYAIDGQYDVIPFIPLLFMLSRPADVAGRVSIRIVDSIKRCAGGPSSDMRKKRGEIVPPTRPEGYASSSVVSISVASWVFTPLDRLSPTRILWPMGTAVLLVKPAPSTTSAAFGFA